jgi:DNA-binding CsgD family transcriptional regulator
VAGELTPLVTGLVYCDVIAACFELADLRRAGEWTGAAMQWCETQPAGMPYRGVCRVHRVEVTTLQGTWDHAEAEALRAADELHVLDPASAGSAFYAIGEIRRRRGDLAGAEDAYLRAHDLGHPAEPGLSLLRLRQGRTDEAAGVLRAPLDGVAVPLPLALLLAARVEVAVALDDDDAARTAATALDELAAGEPGDTAVVALADLARARLLLAEDEPERSCQAARSAWTTFRELRLPHEAALGRVVLGRAQTATGDTDGGRRELEAARRSLDELGAALDVAEVTSLLGEGRPSARPAGLTDREVEVLGLVAAGRTNREVASALYLSEHTVARHLQNIFTKLDVSSRAAATAYAYEHHLV